MTKVLLYSTKLHKASKQASIHFALPDRQTHLIPPTTPLQCPLVVYSLITLPVLILESNTCLPYSIIQLLQIRPTMCIKAQQILNHVLNATESRIFISI